MKKENHNNLKKRKYKGRLMILIISSLVLLGAIVGVIILMNNTKPEPEETVVTVTWPEGMSAGSLYQLDYIIDRQEKKAFFCYRGGENDLYRLYLRHMDGSLESICSMHYEKSDDSEGDVLTDYYGHKGGVQITVSFGENGDFALLKEGESITFVMEAENMSDILPKGESVVKEVTLGYRDFLNVKLEAVCEELGDNNYLLQWNETGASGYRIQMKNQEEDDWITVAEKEDYSDCIYETGRLDSWQDYRYRIAGVIDGEETDFSEEIAIHTGITVMYATVWPTKDLAIYETADKQNKIGNVNLGEAYCVLREENGMFQVYTPEGNGYIDSRYCLINLPDYLGNLCDYNITNSYFSNYMAHEYEIVGVSGMVTAGYENVLLYDGTFLVPLLYPVTEKLITAAEDAWEDGYRLKIYDSFRPYVATRSIYDITSAQLYDPIPDHEMQRLELEDYLLLRNAGLLPVMQSEKDNEDDEETEDFETDEQAVMPDGFPEEYMDTVSENEAEIPADQENADIQSVSENAAVSDNSAEEAVTVPSIMTYKRIMMGSKYPLHVFLAQNGSRHNLGVAMDLTLEKRDSGEELQMQTHMHDLSQYSVLQKNNDMANLLGSYMLGAGFKGLYSEWWHFQDDDVKNNLNPVSVKNGVSVEGWKVDTVGVRYRLADGSYQTGTLEVDGKEYSFNSDGYLVIK